MEAAIFCLVFAMWQKMIGRTTTHAVIRSAVLFVLLQVFLVLWLRKHF